MNTNTELDSRSMASEPGSPTQSAGKKKMEVVSELSSPTFHSMNSRLFERGIKTLLSIRKSARSLSKEKGKEGTGTWKRKGISLRFHKSYEENRTTDCNGVEETGEKTEQEPIQGKPLSVMEINELIQKRQLLEAFASIRYLEDETMAERDADKYKDNPQEFERKSKDVDLLYNSITNAIQSIVMGTLEHPTVEDTMLTSLVTLIAWEEAAHPNTGNPSGPGSDSLGKPRYWREYWKKSVRESARKRVLSIPMASKEEESSWLDLHLSFLQKHLTKDLLKIKLSVKKCYPEEYQVCDMYVKAFHEAIASHLQHLSQRSLEFRELYILLNWVANTYHSELFLGHPDLKPEVRTENLSLLLTPGDWDQLKKNYITSAKEEIKSYFGNILRLEVTGKWEKEVDPEEMENLYHSSLSFDIQTIIGEYMQISGKISRSLETKMLELCLAELHEFIPRFGEKFMTTAQDSPIFVPCFVAYINSFHDLMSRQLLRSAHYRREVSRWHGLSSNANLAEKPPTSAFLLPLRKIALPCWGLERSRLETVFKVNTEELWKILADLTRKFKNIFFNKLKAKAQPLLKKILTKDWILAREKPDSLALAVSCFSEHLQHMREPMGQELLQDVHKYVVREYIKQVIKHRQKMNRGMRQKVSEKMNQEARILNDRLMDQGSDSEWLLPAIHHIARIIGEKKKDKIKDYIQELCQDYPDIRKGHILAILELRGLGRTRRAAICRQGYHRLESPDREEGSTLFAEIDDPVNISCF